MGERKRHNDAHPSTSNSGYEDLLKDLRVAGDLKWTLSFHGPSQIPHAHPDLIKERVIHSERIRDVISQLVQDAKKQKSPEELEELECDVSVTEENLRFKVRRILDEMGHRYNMKYIRLLGFILIKTVRRIYEHVWVNADSIREMEKMFSVADVPVVLMPTHRSYADFLLVSFVMFHYGLPLPVIASGIDFLGMMGVGQVLRRAGAFFIRRSFADDVLYRAVFSEYIQAMVCEIQPMEFFVEGTRSRSGKSLYPKFGLLQTAVEVFMRGKVSDITIIPISITYERTLEENLYARELLGIPKPRESTSGLLKARRVLRDNYGSIWFHMGKPISVRDFMTGKVERSRYGSIPKNRIVMDGQDLPVVKEIAMAMIKEQQNNLKVSDWPILATILLNHLRGNQSSFSLARILGECNDLLLVLRQTAPGHEVRNHFTFDSIQTCLRVHGNIIRLSNDSTTLEFQPDLLRHPPTLHMLLAHYRNQILHRVIHFAISFTVNKVNWPSGNPYEFLKQLFSREFVTLSEDLENSVDSSSATFPKDVLIESVLEPFIVAYDMVLHLMQSSLFQSRSVFRTPKELGTLLQQSMGKLLDDGIYGGFEVLSSDLIANCIQGLKAMDAIVMRDGQLVLNRKVIIDISFQLDTFVSVELLLLITKAVENNFGSVQTTAKI